MKSMFNPFYTLFFRPEASAGNGLTGLFLVFFSCVILAFNAAGQLHIGFLGLLGLIALFLVLGTIGCYWFITSVHFLGQQFSQTSRLIAQVNARSHPWFTTLQGLWPLILLGPAVSAQRWWPILGTLMTLSIILGSGLTLVAAIRRAYDISWLQASLCLVLTLMLGSLAVIGLVGWPIMFLLGAKHFSIALPT
jgi:hypothetical protein